MKNKSIKLIIIVVTLIIFVILIIKIFNPFGNTDVHSLKGKFGCVPTGGLILNADGHFDAYMKIQDDKPFYYIKFSKVILHLSNGKTQPYEPAYFRSENKNIDSLWNAEKDKINCGWFQTFGVGICNSDGDKLFKDNEGLDYFDEFAFFCAKNQKYPSGESCEVTSAYIKLHKEYVKKNKHLEKH